MEGDLAELTDKFLTSIPYSGGTDFSTLPSLFSSGEYDACLVFTDGQDSYNDPSKISFSSPVPLYLYSSSERVDARLLTSWARNSNGELFKTTPKADYPARASTDIFHNTTSQFQLLYCEFEDETIYDFYPKKPTAIGNDGHIEFSWKCRSPSTASDNPGILLKFGVQGNVLWEERVPSHLDSAMGSSEYASRKRDMTSRLVSQAWAKKEISEILNNENDPFDDKVLSISRDYSLVTDKTSLIVLQDLSEYVKHEIEPPASLPLVLHSYLEIIREKQKSSENFVENKMKSLTQLWLRKVSTFSEGYSTISLQKPRYLHFLQPGSAEERWNAPFWEEADARFGVSCNSLKHKREDTVSPEEPALKVQKTFDTIGGYDVTQDADGKLHVEIPFSDDGKNYLGLLTGPRGLTKKRLEEDTGAKLTFQGNLTKGSLVAKEAFRSLSTQFHGKNKKSRMAARISANSKEDLTKMVEKVTTLVTEVASETTSEHRRAQLRRLAEINGTLRMGGFASTLPNSTLSARREEARAPTTPSVDSGFFLLSSSSSPYLLASEPTMPNSSTPMPPWPLSSFRGQLPDEGQIFDEDNPGEKMTAHQESVEKYQQRVAELSDALQSYESTFEFDSVLAERPKISSSRKWFRSRPITSDHLEETRSKLVESKNATLGNLFDVARKWTAEPSPICMGRKTQLTVSTGENQPESLYMEVEPRAQETVVLDAPVVPQDQTPTTKSDCFEVILNTSSWSKLAYELHSDSSFGINSWSLLMERGLEKAVGRREQKSGKAAIFTSLLDFATLHDDIAIYRTATYFLDQLLSTATTTEKESSSKLVEKMYRKMLKMRPEEPNSIRDLALHLIQNNGSNSKLSDDRLKEILLLFKNLLEVQLDKRFAGKQIVALADLTNFLGHLRSSPTLSASYYWACSILCSGNAHMKALLDQTIKADIRITTTWANPEADVELHVFEPDGQECYSFCNATTNGGILSQDCTGYGPEEYLIKRANIFDGKFTVKVKLFGRNDSSRSPILVNCHIWTNFGIPDREQLTKHVVVLREAKEMIEVCQIIAN